MTAYRESGEAPCGSCGEATTVRCATCRQPACAHHVDDRYRQCEPCDDALRAYVRTDDSLAGAFALPLLVLGGVLLGALVPSLVLLAIAAPVVGYPILRVARSRRRRAKFFRAMREHGALPAPRYVELDAADEERLAALDRRRKKRR